MICFSPMEQTKYMVQNIKKPRLCEDVSMGIGDPDIIKDPTLWNYCALTSRLLFLWEDKKIPMKNKPYKFPDLKMYKEDLEKEIGGGLVWAGIWELMCDTSENFNNWVQEFPVGHLSVCKFYGSEKVFRSVVAARTYACLESQGVELSETQKAVLYMVREGV